MKKTFLLSLTLLIISSCALNNVFLNPVPLTNESSFTVFSDNHKDTITLSFTGNNSPTTTNSKNETIDYNTNYKIKSLNFQNSNGDTINGWLVKPNSYNGTTIYFLHGNTGNLAYNFPLAEPFILKGYQVFLIDYSGFGFSKGKAKRKNVLIDANEGLDYLIGRKDVTYNKLIIYGQSLGGHVSCVVAKENENKIDALVIEGAFSSHKDIAADDVPIISRIAIREMYSAERSLPDFHKPVLIIHSREDKRIDFKHGERLFEVANEPKTFMPIQKRHVFGPLFYINEIIEQIEKILR